MTFSQREEWHRWSAAVWEVVGLNLHHTFSHQLSLGCYKQQIWLHFAGLLMSFYLAGCTRSEENPERALSVLTELVFGGLQLDHPPRAFLLQFVFSHGLTGPESPELWGKVL